MSAERSDGLPVTGQVGDDRFDGGDLCLACLAELTAGCGFCPKCAAPVVPTVAYSPLERIHCEGYIYRQAIAAPRKGIIVLGAWLVFLPLGLTGLAMIVWDLFFEETDAVFRLEGMCLLIFGSMGVFQVTQNYLRRPAPTPTSDLDISSDTESTS